MGGEKGGGRREERGEERISQGSCPAISGPWPCLPWCLLTRKTLAISGSGQRWSHSHGPVVPVHEDEEHGSQEEKDG